MSGSSLLRRGMRVLIHPSISDGVMLSRFAINSGTVCEKLVRECYFPKNDWRKPSAFEASLLTGSDVLSRYNIEESVLLFSISEALHAQFWSLDIKELFTLSNSSSPVYSSQYRMFLAEAINFMINDLTFSLSGECNCTIIVNKTGLISARQSHEYDLYTGLDIERRLLTDINTTTLSLSKALINLGDEVSYFLFINLSLRQMTEMLECQQYFLQTDTTSISDAALVRRFLSAFPDYPVIRLAIMPREGILIPVEHVIHDRSTLEKDELEVILTICACFVIKDG
jgi:hypothetical protein